MNKLILASIMSFLFLAGCAKTIPVKDFSNQNFVQYGEHQITTESAELAIVRAAVSLGWTTEKVKPGEIKATLNIRSHQLVVQILFDETTYSINYLDSTNLKYDGEKIHRQYANWVTNLIKNINAQNIKL